MLLKPLILVVPTEGGMPLNVENRTPVVLSLNASLVKVKRHEVKLKIKPVINYKKTTRVGFYCPFAKKFLGVGVDSSLHATFL